MRRAAAIVVVSIVLSACSGVVDNVQQTAQSKFQQFLAGQFASRLESGIDAVVGQLSAKGGYLDDPLVRILLPPPLGLAVGIVRDLQQNPKATLLQILINQAAENAIPVAGPILKDIVTNMGTPTLENVLNAGDTAATDYLKEKGGAAVRTALLPAIAKELHLNGAIELYGELLKAHEEAQRVTTIAADVRQRVETARQEAGSVQAVTQGQLGEYVVEQATAGLFKKVANEELSIRRLLQNPY